jgi:hypothetical protein
MTANSRRIINFLLFCVTARVKLVANLIYPLNTNSWPCDTVKGISISKTEYLVCLMREEKEDIIAVQETHAVSGENYENCPVIGAIYTFPHPTIYVGNLNSHNQLWVYKHNDIVKNLLLKWMTLNKFHLIHHPKDKGSLKSTRRRKDYTPDLSIVTRVSNTLCTRHIIDSNPRSQHRQFFYTMGSIYPWRNQFEILAGNLCQCQLWRHILKSCVFRRKIQYKCEWERIIFTVCKIDDSSI